MSVTKANAKRLQIARKTPDGIRITNMRKRKFDLMMVSERNNDNSTKSRQNNNPPKKRRMNKSTSEIFSDPSPDTSSNVNPDKTVNHSNDNNKKYTKTELKILVEYLDHDQLVDIVKQSVDTDVVSKIVSQKLNEIRNQKIDISDYKRRARKAIQQLDGMKASNQFRMIGKVKSDIKDIINDAQKLAKRGNVNTAMDILLAIADTISDRYDIKGEVFKGIHACGGVDGNICNAMIDIIKNNEEMKTNENIYESIKTIQYSLEDYGYDEYQGVLEIFDI